MSETENVLQTIKTTVQDIVAPDVRELKVRMLGLEGRMSGLEGRMSALEDQSRAQFEVSQRQSDVQFKALMAAISQVRAELELSSYKQIAALSERVAALEARRQ